MKYPDAQQCPEYLAASLDYQEKLEAEVERLNAMVLEIGERGLASIARERALHDIIARCAAMFRSLEFREDEARSKELTDKMVEILVDVVGEAAIDAVLISESE